MARATIAIGLLCALLIPGTAVADEKRIEAGREGDLHVPGCDHPCKLYVPSNYQPGMRLPLIIFLHGAGGKPTSWPWKSATEGEGYLIAGLSYGAFEDGGAGGILSDPASCRAMIAFIDKVRALVATEYGLDQKAVFLTGLSMGGWGTNFYGFHEDARGRYRGYAILAAGPRRGVDHSVAAGLPVMILNGSEDANLAVANQGKPLLEKAGAIVTQVILEGEPHVPSTASMAKPLRAWLEKIRKEDEREKVLAAANWRDVALGDPPAKGEDLTAYLTKRRYVTEADASKPVLLLFVSRGEDKRGKPTKPALASELAERTLFSYPHALGPPTAARSFTCLRIDLSAVRKKESPALHEAMAPLLVVMGTDRGNAVVLPKAKLKPPGVVAALRAHLTEAQIKAADARVARIKPVLMELKKLFGKRKSIARSVAKARRKGPSKKLTAKEKELAALDEKIEALREQLADPAGDDAEK